MRSVVLFLLMFVLLSTSWSQDKKESTPLETTKLKVEQLAKELNLDKDQINKVQDIFLKYETACRKFHESPESDEGEHKKLHEETEKQLQKVLNEKQFTKYMEAKSEGKETGKESMGCSESCSQKCMMNKAKSN